MHKIFLILKNVDTSPFFMVKLLIFDLLFRSDESPRIERKVFQMEKAY